MPEMLATAKLIIKFLVSLVWCVTSSEHYLGRPQIKSLPLCDGISTNFHMDILNANSTMKGLLPQWISSVGSFILRRGGGWLRMTGLSPLLFNIVADMLAILINEVKQDCWISGVVPHLVYDEISILQYTLVQSYLWNTTLRKHVTWSYYFVQSNNYQVLKLIFIKVEYSSLQGTRINWSVHWIIWL